MLIEPRFDTRLKVNGIFVSDEPFGPMLFSLLPQSVVAEVDYKTESGRFISGRVIAPAINDQGWLYTIEAPEEAIRKTKTGDLYLEAPVLAVTVEKILKSDIEKLGWNIEIMPISKTTKLPRRDS